MRSFEMFQSQISWFRSLTLLPPGMHNSVSVLLSIAALVAVLWTIGYGRQRNETKSLAKQLTDSSSVETSPRVDFEQLIGLPEPVAKYFRLVLVDGQSFDNLVRLRQRGELKTDPKSQKWSSFEAEFVVSNSSPAFVWDAKIDIAPALHVRVIDSLIDGVGSGAISLLSVIPIGKDKDKSELNSGALYRFLAEAVWHPYALLPQAGVRWEAVDSNRAIAHLSKSGNSASLEFRFNDFGEITGVYTEERYGRFGGKYIQYPWEGRFGSYESFDGIRIPTEGEVGWHLPSGWWLFWKGRITSVDF